MDSHEWQGHSLRIVIASRDATVDQKRGGDRWSDEDKQRLLALVDEGKDPRDIATTLGRSEEAVRTYARSLGRSMTGRRRVRG